MDNWEEFCGRENSINFQIGGVKIFSLFDGFLVIVSIGQLFIEVFVKSIDFIFWILNDFVQFLLGQPLNMQIASAFVLYQVFIDLSALALPFPDDI